jgi:hypothetical protein
MDKYLTSTNAYRLVSVIWLGTKGYPFSIEFFNTVA